MLCFEKIYYHHTYYKYKTQPILVNKKCNKNDDLSWVAEILFRYNR